MTTTTTKQAKQTNPKQKVNPPLINAKQNQALKENLYKHYLKIMINKQHNQELINEPVWNWQAGPLDIRLALACIGATLKLSPLLITKIQQWAIGNQSEANQDMQSSQSERLVLNLYDIAKVVIESTKQSERYPEHAKAFTTIKSKIASGLVEFEKSVTEIETILPLIDKQRKYLIEPVFKDFANTYIDTLFDQLNRCAPALKFSNNEIEALKEYYAPILFATSDWNINTYHIVDRHCFSLYRLANEVHNNPQSDAIAKLKHILKLPGDIGIRRLFTARFNMSQLEKTVDAKVWQDVQPISHPADGICVVPELIPSHWLAATTNQQNRN